ncbi:MAG: sodium:solute symporter family protein [Proteobacteria bacterium]|nr:sodium:solute symporter family protein [Pseudomonadota bacterium]MBU1741117.1 sodium:solute symporter family protein [Pseudomonadota bacterium]
MWLEITLAVACLAVTLTWGWYGWRRTHTAIDYLVAGRMMGPSVMALSYGGTFVSTAAMLGLVGLRAGYGLTRLWPVVLGLVLGLCLILAFMGRRTRRLGAALGSQTFAGLLADRYDSRFIRVFTGAIVFLFIPLSAAAVLIGVARMLEAFLGLPYFFALIGLALIVSLYVVYGGLKAVMYSDAWQALLVLAALVFLLVATIWVLGGPAEASRSLFASSPLTPVEASAAGRLDWTRGPAPGSPLWWTALTGLGCGLGLGVLVAPQLVIRFMAVRGEGALSRGALFGGLFILAAVVLVLAVGGLSDHLFLKNVEPGVVRVPPALSLWALAGNGDAAAARIIKRFLPAWYAAPLLLGFMALALSAISSQVHVGGASFGRDVVAEAWRGHIKGGQAVVMISRFGVALSIVAAVLWAKWLPDQVMAAAPSFFFGLCAATFLPAYGLGLFWRRMNGAGAAASMVVGLLASVLHAVFVHAQFAPALGVCQWLLGRPTVLADLGPRIMGWGFQTPDLNYLALPLESWVSPWWQVQFLDLGLMVLPLSLTVAVAVAWLTPAPAGAHVERCRRALGPKKGGRDRPA